MSPITIRDVAKRAEVSIKTVSRVLNQEAYVKEETRAKVEDVIQELRYVASLSARRLASGQSFTIGLIVYNASWHYLHNVQKGVMETAQAHGYNVLLHPCDITIPQEIQKVLDLVHQRQVDGLIFTPPADNASALIEELKNLDVPFNRLSPTDRKSPLPYVATTDKQGAFDMTKYLIGLGHQRIGFVYGPKEQRAPHDRFSGYRQAISEANIGFEENLIVYGDDHFQSGLQAATSLLAVNSRPSAIFCNNDEMAAGAISAVFESGMRVPEDVAIAGFDNTPLAKQIYPPLTTIEQPIFQMAEVATKHLFKIINGDDLENLHVEIPTKLIIRKSTGFQR
ncbi:MAG: LacI family transcriptional regulator [Anaerolineaceae bacterium]|nr:LacI family transcriptional regulator [Anaerolineaceae bacterium]